MFWWCTCHCIAYGSTVCLLSAVGYIQAHTDPHVVLTVVYLQYMRNELEFHQKKYVHTYVHT